MEIYKEESSGLLISMSEKERTQNQLKYLEEQVAILNNKATDLYDSGWNNAMDLAASRLDHQFRNAFGSDTLSSIAIYIRSLRK